MKRIFLMAALAMGLCLSSCTEKIEPVYSDKPVSDVALQAILKAEGVNFNAAGCILIDDAAKAITELNLSGKKITDISGLEALPNLSVLNLSDNLLGPVFDFANVPASVTSIDLTKNEIFEYNNLIDLKVAENGDEFVKLIHDFSKFSLPESAKHSCVEIPLYFTNDSEVEMTMGGKPYTTLREVPDEFLRGMLKDQFSNLFTEDKIDISKRFTDPTQMSTAMYVMAMSDMEGAQYVAMNPSYKGAVVSFTTMEPGDLPYIKLDGDLSAFLVENINTGYINTKESTNLVWFYSVNNQTIEEVDLSASTKLGQRGATEDFNTSNNPSDIQLTNCPKLTSLVLPENAKYIRLLSLLNLPKLEKWNMSSLKGIVTLRLANMPGLKELTYFTPDGFYGWGDQKKMELTMSEDVYKFASTKDFINKYRNNLIKGMMPDEAGCPDFDWTTVK